MSAPYREGLTLTYHHDDTGMVVKLNGTDISSWVTSVDIETRANEPIHVTLELVGVELRMEDPDDPFAGL